MKVENCSCHLLKLKRVALLLCAIGCGFATNAWAQSSIIPVFDPTKPFTRVLTCENDYQISLSNSICKEFESEGSCVVYFSTSELRNFLNGCHSTNLEKEAQRIIYDNCVIAKSVGLDGDVLKNVRSACERIAQKPTLLQRWRWGN